MLRDTTAATLTTNYKNTPFHSRKTTFIYEKAVNNENSTVVRDLSGLKSLALMHNLNNFAM